MSRYADFTQSLEKLSFSLVGKRFLINLHFFAKLQKFDIRYFPLKLERVQSANHFYLKFHCRDSRECGFCIKVKNRSTHDVDKSHDVRFLSIFMYSFCSQTTYSIILYGFKTAKLQWLENLWFVLKGFTESSNWGESNLLKWFIAHSIFVDFYFPRIFCFRGH